MSTPDTYAEQQRTGWPSFYYDFARKLERERDDYKARFSASVREIERLNIANTLDESKELDKLRAEVERLKANKARLLCLAYNSGYKHGHHDTVEAQYADIHQSDMETYHADEVAEIDAAIKEDE